MFGWDDVAVAGIGLFGHLFGAGKQAKAAKEAAAIEAAAQKYSADLQAKATADTLAFTRGQAQNAWQNSEVDRRGNYDQWAARERRVGSIGALVGLGPREIPGFVSGVDPQFGGAPGPSSSQGAPTAPTGPTGINWTADPAGLTAQLTDFFTKRGVAPTEVPYWVSKAGELVARGKQINNPGYADQRLNAAEIFGGGGGGAPTSRPAVRPIAAYMQTPFAPVPIAPGVPRVGSVGSYF